MSSDGKYGGSVVQKVDPKEHTRTPQAAVTNQFKGTSDGYKEAAIRDGIAHKKAGLFPPEDRLLADLAANRALHPFEKHLSGTNSPYEVLKKGGWATGNSAAENGLDLRLFYQRKQPGEKYGTVFGAARLGDRASIGDGFWMSAHGGAIETLLDESTAELAKMDFAPLIGTIEANFKLKKAVPLHTSLKIECKITKIAGMRCWVTGTLKLPDSDTVLATCEAQLVDLKQILMAQ